MLLPCARTLTLRSFSTIVEHRERDPNRGSILAKLWCAGLRQPCRPLSMVLCSGGCLTFAPIRGSDDVPSWPKLGGQNMGLLVRCLVL